MSLFQRMKTTAAADAHGVIDALEDRALLLKQYVREAEVELDRKRGQLQAIEAELRSLEREQQATADELSRLEADAETALAAGNDELSRYALKGVLRCRGRQRRQAHRLEQLMQQRADLSRLVADQAERFEGLRDRVQAELRAAGGDASFEMVSDEQVELELMRRKGARQVSS